MSADFLFELRSEEIPARMQDRARDDLARLFAAELAKAGLKADAITTYATPRRLALIARGLPLETAAVSEETKGPKVGAPPQAMEGFLRKCGLTQDQLTIRDGVYFAVVEKAGRKTADVLAEAVPAIIRAFPWPKSMRWGAASQSTTSLRWVRPLQGIVALLGGEVVRCEIDGLVSGQETMGHRFHSSGAVTIDNTANYAAMLRAAHVIVDQDERKAIIRDGAVRLATQSGLSWIEDEALVAENAGLTEWPVPLLGDFDECFLEVPPEVIRLTLATNQKYFVCRYPSPLQGRGGSSIAAEGEGDARSEPPPSPTLPPEGERGLAPAFICTANIVANDGGAGVVAGNRKVLSARLSDARFFWDQDKKKTLAEHAEGLSRITFHEKLGTVADKVDRVAKLARWLVEEGIIKPSPLQGRGLGEGDRGEAVVEGGGAQYPSDPPPDGGAPPPHYGEVLEREHLAAITEQAARLCKADLVTEMVGEFPELQGVMGGYYARAEGLPDAVADAIRDHYKPVGQGDDVPTAPVTVAVSLADKLDTITQFFDKNIRPTGSKDPFALRRAALGIVSLIVENDLRVPLRDVFAMQPLQSTLGVSLYETREFFVDRLKVQQRGAGIRHDLIDAVFALGDIEFDLVRLLARVHALQSFMATDDGANLLAAYKRAANILKQAGEKPSPLQGRGLGEGASATTGLPLFPALSPEGEREQEENALLTALDSAEPLAAAAVAEERFADAMTALASLRAPIDAFFDGVMVNDPEPAVRAFRLGLLGRFRDACHAVADFSKIEG